MKILFILAHTLYKILSGKLPTGYSLKENQFKAMLGRLVEEMRRMETEARVGVPKGKHSQERRINFSGYWVIKPDAILASIYPTKNGKSTSRR